MLHLADFASERVRQLRCKRGNVANPQRRRPFRPCYGRHSAHGRWTREKKTRRTDRQKEKREKEIERGRESVKTPRILYGLRNSYGATLSNPPRTTDVKARKNPGLLTRLAKETHRTESAPAGSLTGTQPDPVGGRLNNVTAPTFRAGTGNVHGKIATCRCRSCKEPCQNPNKKAGSACYKWKTHQKKNGKRHWMMTLAEVLKVNPPWRRQSTFQKREEIILCTIQ